MRGQGFLTTCWKNEGNTIMSIKEIVILVAILALGYWLGKSGALSKFIPG
jgi:hypothetical protein